MTDIAVFIIYLIETEIKSSYIIFRNISNSNMKYENCCIYIVVSDKRLPFYGIEIDYGKEWIIVDKINLMPVDYLTGEEFDKKYKTVENSYMRIGGGIIHHKCIEVLKDFIPEVFKHCASDLQQDNDEISASNLSAIGEMYRSKAKRILQKIKGKPLHFKSVSYRDVYMVPEDIIVNNWTNETMYFPELRIQGNMIMTDYWTLNFSMNLEKTEEFFGYADEIFLKDKLHIPQDYEIVNNLSNKLCLEIEDKYKMFMEMLRQSIPYNKILEANKNSRK